MRSLWLAIVLLALTASAATAQDRSCLLYTSDAAAE